MNIGATVVTSSSEMIRGLVRVTRSARRDGLGQLRSPPGRVVGRFCGSTTGVSPGVECQDHQGRPDERAHQEVSHPERRRQQLEHHGHGDTDLGYGGRHHQSDRAPERPAGGVGAPAQPDGERDNESEEAEREGAMGPGQKSQRAPGGKDRPVTEWKAQAQQAGVEVGHLCPEQDHHEPQSGRGEHQPVRRMSSDPAGHWWPGGSAGTGPQGGHDDHREQHHRVGQVGDDDPGWQGQLDRHGAEQHLNHQQHQGEGGRISEGPVGPMASPGYQAHCQDHDADQRGGPAMADLDHGGKVERREPLTMAAGPVVAAPHAGAGDADHPAEHDEAEGQGSSGPCQAAKQPGGVLFLCFH